MGKMKELWEQENLMESWQPSDDEINEMYDKWLYDEMNEQGLRTA